MKLEKIEKNSTYHIYNRGINGCSIYRTNENKRYFLSLFQKYLGAKISLFAFCLMNNHFHFLLEIVEEEKQTTQSFSNFFNAYAKAFNKQEKRTGSLFEKHFKRKKVTDKSYLRRLFTYIHNNPVVDKEGYPFSSYRHYLNETQPKAVHIDKSIAIHLFESVENMRFITSGDGERLDESSGLDLQGPLREDLAGPDDNFEIRLSLINPDDAAALNRLILANKKTWSRFFPETVAKNETLEKAITFIDSFYQGRQPMAYLYTVKESVAAAALLGLVYLKEIDWETKKGELAYAIDNDYSGKGLMTTAVREVIAIAFDTLGLRRLEIFVHNSNIPSVRVAARCGFKWESTKKNGFTPPGESPLDMELYVLYNER